MLESLKSGRRVEFGLEGVMTATCYRHLGTNPSVEYQDLAGFELCKNHF